MLRTQFSFSTPIVAQVIIASAICAGLALTLEPGDTSQMPLLAEYGLWFTHFLTFATIYLGGVWALQRLGCPAPWDLVVSAILMAPLATAASLLLDYGFGAPDEELSSAMSLWAVFISEMIAVAPLALTMAVALAFVLRRETPQQPQTSTKENPPALSDLIPSAPQSLGNDIIRLHALDHYVELVTTKGTALLTEQFGDCVARLSDLNGVQCHRSHWISLNHVTALKPTGSTYACILSNGDDVPVSRRRYSDLRDVVRAAANPTSANKNA